MASTYVNDLRLEEQATGENSGSWGTKLNSSLEQIAEAFSYGSEAIADASTHTITMADGASDEARSFYLKCTGGGQACTVTLAPNTVSKVWMIENATSYTLTFTQGSGANVAVLAGEVKMLATDGAGSGAVVYDLLTDVNVADSLKISGTTPTLTIGDAGAEDTKIVFDGNAQDFYIGLDDSADDLVIGKGSAVGTTPAIVIDEDLKVGINFATPTAKLSLPAQASGDSGIARFAIESAVDSNDFTIAQYEDGTGTYTQIGQNISLTSGGNVTVLDSAHKTAGITFDGRGNGSLMFQTGAANANAERMRIDSSGNVGIGTSSLARKLHVHKASSGATSTSDSVAVIEGDDNTELSILGGSSSILAINFGHSGDANDAIISYNTSSGSENMAFTVNAAERMRIDSSGTLLVDRTSKPNAGEKVAVSKEGIAIARGTSSGEYRLMYGNDSASMILYFSSGSNQAQLSAAGAWVDASDVAYKKDIVDINYGLDTVKKLKPRTYKMKPDDEQQIGFVAQELELDIPEIVNGEDGSKGVAYGQLTAVLTKAIQELEARLKTLEDA